MWGEIIWSFPNFNGCTVEVSEWTSSINQALCNGCDYLSILGLNLTHWGRVTHIWFADLATIGLDNGLSPVRCQAIISTNAGILLIGPLGTNFSETLIRIQIFSFKKMHYKMSSAKWRSFLSRSQCVNPYINKRDPRMRVTIILFMILFR